MSTQLTALYRNLKYAGTYSTTPCRIGKNGVPVKDSGVTHVTTGTLTNIMVSSKTSTATGCKRILTSGRGREVVAFVAGTFSETARPNIYGANARYIGRLTLSLVNGRFEYLENGQEFIPTSTMILSIEDGNANIYEGA